jgi:hypothetical protein
VLFRRHLLLLLGVLVRKSFPRNSIFLIALLALFRRLFTLLLLRHPHRLKLFFCIASQLALLKFRRLLSHRLFAPGLHLAILLLLAQILFLFKRLLKYFLSERLLLV